MSGFRSGAGPGTAASLFALFVAGLAALTAAQGPATSPAPAADASRPHKSVYGKLQSVDKTRNSVVMIADSGQKLAWRFDAAVITEAAAFKPGAPMIVIYRQVASNEKRVTALAFPGTAAKPTYVNTTGGRVILRSAPMVGEVCGKDEAAPVSESTIPSGGMAESLEACWCCAPSGESCTPGNKSGLGRALLVQCFK